MMIRVLMLLVALHIHTASFAAEEIVSFDNPQQGEMYHALLKQYRCLKCQNQNLADSHASLAGDLRREIKAQIIEGKSKQDIDEYLVSRYGEFVLYRPRFSAKTAVLWIAPFVLLMVVLICVFKFARRGKSSEDTSQITQSDDSQEQHQAKLEKAKKLLDM